MNRASNNHVESRQHHWIEPDDMVGLERFLRARDWLADDEIVRTCRPAGEGNMNLTLRVRSNRRTLIVKQARPWVEKYPHIAAPWDRLLAEARFYRTVADLPDVGGRMPRLVALDADARVIVLEDLAPALDMTGLYRGETIGDETCRQLGVYLAALHNVAAGEPCEEFANREMRNLNHAHLYRLPLDEPDLSRLESLEAGLGDAALTLATDDAYRGHVAATGARYLRDGVCLVHGDFFPGSWLLRDDGLWVIDAEFSFLGDAEFDLGTTLAHLALSNQSRFSAEVVLDSYRVGRGVQEYAADWVARYAAAEVMRRLIGVAQLPIPPSRGWRREVLERSRATMLEESWEKLWS